MTNQLTKPGKLFAYKQSALITFIVFMSTLVIYFVCGFNQAKSAALGGAIGIVPNLLFAYKAFKYIK